MKWNLEDLHTVILFGEKKDLFNTRRNNMYKKQRLYDFNTKLI